MPTPKDFLPTTLLLLLRRLLGEVKVDLGRRPPFRAIHNLMEGLYHCRPELVASAIVARYPHCYMVNADYPDYPHIDFVEYRALSPVGDVPLVRVKERVLKALPAHRVVSLPQFTESGATRIRGGGGLPLPKAAAIVETIRADGWRVMTVDDAHRILDGRDHSGPEGGYLTKHNGWISNVQDKADRIKIAESLFPICERIVDTRVAAMVIYTPGLPSPFRLWRRSLAKVMPQLPPRA